MQTNEPQNDNYNGLNAHSKESSEFPLMVNCAGKLTINHPFLTYNKIGRLDYYLLYMTKGSLKVRLNGETKRMCAGDFIIFPPKFKYWYALEESSEMSYFFVHFTGSHVTEYLRALKISQNPEIRHVRSGEELSLAISSFLIDYESGGELKDVALSVEFSRILVLLAKSARFGTSSHALSKSLCFINENYSDEIRIPDLAALEGLSVSRYNFLFKESVGTSPIKYITNLRMRQAQMLLERTELSVKQIAQAVGYEDNHFFSKHFKSYVGTTPTDYRFGGKALSENGAALAEEAN